MRLVVVEEVDERITRLMNSSVQFAGRRCGFGGTMTGRRMRLRLM